MLHTSSDPDGQGRPQWGLLVLSWLKSQDRTQAWLARNAKVHPMHLSNCLLGKSQVGISVLSRLEDAMELTPGKLLMAAREAAVDSRNDEG